LKVRPPGKACNYTDELAADAGEDSGSGYRTTSTRI
jgi:hypothetical protein